MRKMAANFILCGILWLLLSGGSSAQEISVPDTVRSAAPKVFVDCSQCGEDYIRTEITFVNFVRDRREADIHIFVTTQGTGGGGAEFTVEFIGQGRFSEMHDTLKCVSVESDSEDMVRQGLIRVIRMGLLRYAAKTPVADYLSVVYTPPSKPAPVIDKWNCWVFKIALSSGINGQESFHSYNFNGSISASRVTEQSRIRLSANGNYYEQRYKIVDDEGEKTIVGISRSKGISGSFIRSMGRHWSLGISSSISAYTYGNVDCEFYAAPALEYNLFPYDQSTNRQLRFVYHVGLLYYDYMEETIYSKTSEWLNSEMLEITLELKRPWGSVELSMTGYNYLHDFKKNNLQLYGEMSFRLFEGFSFNVSGWASRVRDQLSLRKRQASVDEVLLQQQELETGYKFWANLGISYSFGSIYNNIVNPRFGY